MAGAGALFVSLVVAGAGWYNQAYLKEQYTWRIVMKPTVLTAAREREMAAKPGSDFTECGNGCPAMIVDGIQNKAHGTAPMPIDN